MRHNLFAALGALAAVAAVTLSQLAASPSPADAAPNTNLVGTWTGRYQFPTGTDQLVTSTETLVIQHQDGLFLWGHDDYVQGGQTIQIPVRGSLETNRRDFTLAERNGFFRGVLLPSRGMQIRFTRTDDQFTSFAAVLHRSP